jgi:chromosome segregation protein
LSSASLSLADAQRAQELFKELREFRSQFDAIVGSLNISKNAEEVGDAVSILDELAEQHAPATAELTKLESLEARLIEEQLTTQGAIDVSSDLLRQTRIDLFTVSDEQLAEKVLAVERDQASLSARIKETDAKISARTQQLQSTIRSAFQGLREPEYVVPLIGNRLSAVSRTLNSSKELLVDLTVNADSDLNSLRSMLASAVRSLRASVSFEQQLRDRSERLQSCKNELEAAHATVATTREPLERVEGAFEALAELRRDQGIQQTMDGFLRAYKSAILAVFKNIHSPAEFRDLVLGEGEDKSIRLVRQDGASARITEISTGQRSALALSIFLALNRSVKDRLNLLLIDDPVANVDDLNSLAFLDYLRNVAISGTQILFATADEKLAKLFEMKFSVLGETTFQALSFVPRIPLEPGQD